MTPSAVAVSDAKKMACVLPNPSVLCPYPSCFLGAHSIRTLWVATLGSHGVHATQHFAGKSPPLATLIYFEMTMGFDRVTLKPTVLKNFRLQVALIHRSSMNNWYYKE